MEEKLNENALPEDEPVQQEQGQEQELEQEKEPEISIQDGEVNFSDDFFGDVPEKAADNKELKPQIPQNPEPNYYSDEELTNVPIEQWDKERMPDDVKRYVEAYQKQMEARERQREIQQKAQTPPDFLTPPKQYTPQELHEEAMKMAVEKLGLKSTDEFDAYEGLHQTALEMARQELMQKHYAETANYQRQAGEYQQWQMFSGQLAGQSDFNDFHQWYLGEVTKNGNTLEQINAGLEKLAREQGYGAVQRVWAEFYRLFKADKAPKPIPKTKPKMPPTLESSRGGNNDGRRTFDLRNFGKLDDDAQAQALIDMGLV